MNALALAARLLDIVFPAQAPERRSHSVEKLASSHSLAPAPYDAILASLSATALFAYKDARVRSAIQSLKYDGRKDTLTYFMPHAQSVLHHELTEHTLIEKRPILVIPIPLSPRRYLERGFNQSALIAKALVEQFPHALEYCDSCLVRKDFAQSQTKARTRKERAKNTTGVFEVHNEHLVRNRHILIVDDVITTGATMHEAARILRAAHVKRISGFALAH